MLHILSILLSYPRAEWLAHLDDIEAVVHQYDAAGCSGNLRSFFAYLRQHDEIALQEQYVSTFDRNRRHSLHLFEHLHGEDRARGQAMVDLLAEYQAEGFEPKDNELPDYLPLFLEFLSQVDAAKADDLLGDAVHVVAYLADNLREDGSIYAPLLEAVVALSPVAPQPLQAAPVRDMDEALAMFGPTPEGVEPLLSPTLAAQPVQFFPPNMSR